jgi:hypothetical protein
LHFAIAPEGCKGGVEDGDGTGIGRALDAVVHPLPFPSSRDNAGAAQVGQVAGDFWLTLLEDLDEVTDADLAAVHQVEQAQAGAVRQRGKERGQIGDWRGTSHEQIIYALTDMYYAQYIRFSIYEEMHHGFEFHCEG